MLTHGFNGNMKTAVLLSGDLDFRPIIEAPVRHGVFVEVWYHRTSIAAELPGAADFGREIRFQQLYSWNTKSFQRKHRVPNDDRRPDASVRSEQVVRTGSLGEHAVELYKAQGERPRFFLWINTGQWESIVINDEDPDLIDRYVRIQYGPITWQLSEQELREMNDRVAGKSA
jgi:hypothetical protein